MSRFARRTLAVLALGAVSIGVLSTPAHASENSKYVALGDSFTAGPLIPDQVGSPLGCLRSNQNYPSLVAEGLGVDEFVDVSCSGATTEDMFAPQSTYLGTNNPQLDALTDDTTLVSLGIGGNDIGFVSILVDCLKKGALNPFGSPCQDAYTDPGTGTDQLKQRVADNTPKFAEVLAAIAERAPNAQVVVVGYPAIMPESGGCWPKLAIGRGDVPYLDSVEQELNAALAQTASDFGATYVDTYDRGHDVCADRDDRWVEGIIPTQWAAPVHPNAEGMAALAESTLESIG